MKDTLETLKEIMKKEQLTVYKLAALSGLRESTINSAFSRNNITTKTLEVICEAIGYEIIISKKKQKKVKK